MTFWFFLIAIGLAWVVQSLLSFKQTQEFTRRFVALRRRGRVAMGKFRGGIAAGSIVMMLLDDDDHVVEGQRLGGVTVVARFKSFDDYVGQFVGDIDPAAAKHLGPSVVKAVTNLVANYQLVNSGETPPEPPTAVARLLDKLPGVTPKKRVLPSPVAASPAGAARKTVVTRKSRDRLAA